MGIGLTLGHSCHPHFRLISRISNVRMSCFAALERVDESDGLSSNSVGERRMWKKFSSKELGITNSMISKPTRIVLNGLKRQGFDAYLVGGCVRDLILKRPPKDFDVLTTAELKEVRTAFSRSEIVGKRFPICHVHVGDDIVEVSSFSTSARHHLMESEVSLQRHDDCDEKDHSRWRNCMERDLTINGLMFDPYAQTIYDYIGGMEDIKKAKVRTIHPASVSFVEDCARILRAIRIAARLEFSFSRETAHATKHLAQSVLLLDKGRHLMEMNYMLAYGSAEPSLRLLWRFGLLELLLPIQAAYFVRDGLRRRDKKTNMLLALFSNMDKLLAPDRPCHSSLWVAILALHMALLDRPRDPLVVAAFSLAVHNGGDMEEAIGIAQRISTPHATFYYELSDSQYLEPRALKKEVLELGVSVSKALSNMTDSYYVSQALRSYPKAPKSDMVFIPLLLYLKAVKIFECVNHGKEARFVAKQGGEIDYKSLAMGNVQEVRHVFARIVFDTIYPLDLDQN
ncbi:polynucleotide adenylyltransferase family protein [Artemisia annua]|uniref:Polynucleotide adenylyltransferase family protein n=1 Tax=Artemisia annua TaxID=35608 RepID=A0A2U1PR19_ARTAN|nr:polynucleotide adenylyltransferase family protein [Artemisia annua]